ncbi:MAG TPA: type I-U CRISPR-associated protein Csb2 [Acidimicrobiales bacterium]|nr:type I-U CRISPR-associated protein Csb2 [Acidimicrobiales bacterium]
MLAIEVTLLTGRYVATRSNDRDRPEWPPHPARLFSAMVSAYADREVPDGEERLALEWFEALGAPSICCTDAPPTRALVTSFVPVNDATVLRDQRRLYERIIEAEGAVASLPADTPPKAREKAVAKLDKVLARAVADTQRATQAPETASASVANKALELFPDHRGRQPRTYPTIVPRDERIWYVWSAVDALPAHTAVLDGLLARVARLGHSSSMVSCRVAAEPPAPTFLPDDGGSEPIRVTAPGLLSALEAEYAYHRGSEPRSLPAVVVPYRIASDDEHSPSSAAAPLLGEEWIVLRRSGKGSFSLRQSLDIARVVRKALISHAPEPVHEIVSGHAPGRPGERTAPTTSPHLAVVPLPNVGNQRADGRLLGIGLILPRDVSLDGRKAVQSAVRRWQETNNGLLRIGDVEVCRFEEVTDEAVPWGLQPGRWCRPTVEWASVTPIALDRHPGDLRSERRDRRTRAEEEARTAIVRACVYAGLPEPAEVEVRLDTPWRGVPPLRRFAPFRTGAGKGPLVRCSVHARLWFDEPVRGPVLIGAGRFYGYGLFAPVPGRERSGGVRGADRSVAS